MRWTLIALLLLNLLTLAWLAPRAIFAQRLLVVSWGNLPGAPAELTDLYGAHVFVQGSVPELQVKLRIYIDRPSWWAAQQRQDQLLGQAVSFSEAQARWGSLHWLPQGLQVGQGAQAVLVPAAELQSHR